MRDDRWRSVKHYDKLRVCCCCCCCCIHERDTSCRHVTLHCTGTAITTIQRHGQSSRTPEMSEDPQFYQVNRISTSRSVLTRQTSSWRRQQQQHVTNDVQKHAPSRLHARDVTPIKVTNDWDRWVSEQFLNGTSAHNRLFSALGQMGRLKNARHENPELKNTRNYKT